LTKKRPSFCFEGGLLVYRFISISNGIRRVDSGALALLLLEKGDWMQKIVDFLVFLMLGVASAESFANGHAAFHILYGHPKRPIFAEGISATYVGWVGLWISAALTIAAIYLLGNRKLSGWYYGLIGDWVAVIAGGATHYVRHATSDYLHNVLMGVSLVVMLLIPVFKQRLLKEYSG
jgi:hypothetical protein